LTNTVSGPLPSTIERVAAYTPLVTSNFNDILTVYDNNLQAAMDRLDDHHHGAQLYTFDTEKPVPDDDDLFALIDSTTLTHLTRKIKWSELKAFITGGPFGDGSDGDVVINVDTTLTRDMQYNNFTVNVGVTLNAGGYYIKVRGTLLNKGTISCDGGDGGTGASGGAASPGNNTLRIHGCRSVSGGSGAAGVNNGAGGAASTVTVSFSLCPLEWRAGSGGGGGGNHGSVATAGGQAHDVFCSISTGVGGSGAGTGNISLTGGGGGGGAGVFCLWVNIINNVGVISSNGGNGGNGQVSGSNHAGNGGGGAGGYLCVYYGSTTGSGVGTVQALGGAAGTGGNGGAAGNTGSTVLMNI
jgi:hypothetical protein